MISVYVCVFFFQAEDGIRDLYVTGVQTCALPICHIAARHREGLRLIPIDEVQYFLADQKYTTVRHVNGEDLIEDSLRLLESEFGVAFVRVHRNALVGVKYLERIERTADGQYFVRLRGCEAPLQVSRRMAGELKERFRI